MALWEWLLRLIGKGTPLVVSANDRSAIEALIAKETAVPIGRMSAIGRKRVQVFMDDAQFFEVVNRGAKWRIVSRGNYMCNRSRQHLRALRGH